MKFRESELAFSEYVGARRNVWKGADSRVAGAGSIGLHQLRRPRPPLAWHGRGRLLESDNQRLL